MKLCRFNCVTKKLGKCAHFSTDIMQLNPPACKYDPVDDQQGEVGRTVLIYFKIHNSSYIQGLLTIGRSLYTTVSLQGGHWLEEKGPRNTLAERGR
jgi:hypothetical protein